MKNKAQLNSYSHLRNKFFTRRSSLLIIGFLLILLSDMRGSADLFAWFMPLPFLIYIALYHGVKNHLWLLLSLLLGSILTLMKTASDPYFASMGFSIMMGIVIGLRYFIVFLLWGYIRKWNGKLISIIAFPALVLSFEYLQAYYTPFGDWGALANTQVYNLPLLQTASLFGYMGISAIMAWASVLFACTILGGSLAANAKQIIVFVLVLTALYVWGDLRLDKVPDGKHISVAAIMTDNKLTEILPSPDDPQVVDNTNELIEKTRIAANRGAAIAVWGEGSTLISHDDEAGFLQRLSSLAKTHKIAIVAAYAVPLPKGQKDKFENKFSWIHDNGEIAETYLKHHPVPGEGSRPGIKPLELVHNEHGNMAGAICYDYDFPLMGLTHARLGADLVLLPGMDWRGMLYRHTLMARIRAIEGGFSLLRSANEATSIGFNNYGKVMAAMPDFGNNDKILIASLPVGKIETLYTRVGNLIAYIAIAGLLFSLIVTIINYRRRKHTNQ